jgi:hypothetical protein
VIVIILPGAFFTRFSTTHIQIYKKIIKIQYIL